MNSKYINVALLATLLSVGSAQAATVNYSASECKVSNSSQASLLEVDQSGGLTNTISNAKINVVCPIALEVEHDITEVNVYYQGQSASSLFQCTLNFTNLRNGWNGAYSVASSALVQNDSSWFRDKLSWSNISITSFSENATLSARLECAVPGVVASSGTFQLTGYSVVNTK
jgi:hypothetical protein